MDNNNNNNKEPLNFNKKEYMKKYYEEKKDTYYNEELTCEVCARKYKRYNKFHHTNTKKHKDLVELNRLKNELIELKSKQQ